ncbi:MAG: DUF748 domain-containing protein [Methylococcales bacterium]|nr:MAG: DUF748 domain-containing protein [Methylococcales bacterium]
MKNIPEKYKKPSKFFLITCSVITIYSLFGFVLIPSLVKWKLPEFIHQETGRHIKLENIQLNPFLLSASLKGFEIQELNGQVFASFDNFDLEINALQSIKQSALVLDKVWLNKLFVRITKQKDSEFNFNDLLKTKKTEKPNEPAKLFPLIISVLSLTEGKLSFEDPLLAKPIKEDILPINLEIENFSTHTDQKSKINLSMVLNSGGQLEWNGEIGISPLYSLGKIKINDIKLEGLSELILQDKIRFDLKGTATFEADYVVNDTKNGLEFKADNTWIDLQNINLTGLNPNKVSFKIPSLILKANYTAFYANHVLDFSTSESQLDVKGFELYENEQHKVLVKIPSLGLRGIDVNTSKQELGIESLTVDNANINAWLTQEGIVNYQSLFSTPLSTEPTHPAPIQAQPPAPIKAPWLIHVNNLNLDNLGIGFEDKSLKTPALFDVKPINFKLSQFSTEKNAKSLFQLSIGLNKTGLIKLNGDTVIEPFNIQSTVDIKTVALDNFQSYMDKFARLDIIDGTLNINGQASLSMAENNKLDIKFKGDSEISDLISRDRKLYKDLVKWKKLSLKDMDIDLISNRYTAKELVIDKPYARVIIRKDKTINFADIFVAADDSKSERSIKTSTVKPPDSEQSKPYFKLDKFQLTDGSSDFSDLSLVLPFAAEIESLDGSANGISSDQKSEIKIDLKGKTYDFSPVDIKGSISPYLGNYTIEMNFQGMSMPFISPYMAEFAGYKIEKGKLNLGLEYNVVDKNLTASNHILMDQFELGEKVENPNAVSLPLELAIALLKDSNGKIKIDFPITGSLEDPEFSIGSLIGDAFLNVLSKIITSPFSSLISMMGSEEDLSTVSFAAGGAMLNQQQMNELEGLAKALKDRPDLSLEIKGVAYQELDWPAMLEGAVMDHLRKSKAAEINKNGGKITRAEYIDLSVDDYIRLLAKELSEKFPTLTEQSILGTPKLVAPKEGDIYEVAKQKLFSTLKPDQERLKHLASDRAQAIAKLIVQKGGIENDRVFLLDTVINPERDKKEIVSLLSLKSTH